MAGAVPRVQRIEFCLLFTDLPYTLIGRNPFHLTVAPFFETNKTEISALVGKKIAEKASSKGIDKVVFDRGGFLYHGRVKALAEAAREAGLKF